MLLGPATDRLQYTGGLCYDMYWYFSCIMVFLNHRYEVNHAGSLFHPLCKAKPSGHTTNGCLPKSALASSCRTKKLRLFLLAMQ